MTNPTVRIKAFCDTIDAQFGETLVADTTVRLGGQTARQQLEAPTSLPVFDTLQGSSHLEIGEPLGEGGMGLVRLATQRNLHRSVAIKTVRPERESWDTNQDLYREALATGVLEHPNIIPIYSLYQNERGSPVIVMKRVEGVSWHECIADVTKIPDIETTDRLTWNLEVFDEACRALHFAHELGIIHRDIKPDNIMIGRHGEVYVLDWGIAVTTDDEKASFLNHVDNAEGIAGTPVYMAPELATGETDQHAAQTDVYLLGATLYHALEGKPPHDGDTIYDILLAAHESVPVEFSGSVPDELRRIIHRAMSPSIDVRYDTVEELRRAVHSFRDHRASIALSDEAAHHLQAMRGLIADDADPSPIRRSFDRCKFGCEHAITVWDDNEDARRVLQEATEHMAEFELDARNLDAAEALLDGLTEPPASIVDRLESLRTDLADEAKEVAALRSLERSVSVSTGADYRTRGAAVAWVLLTVMPLLGHFNSEALDQEMSTFFAHGVAMFVLLSAVLAFARKGLLANDANRKIGGIIFVFALSLPLVRYVAWQTEMSLLSALLMEGASYTVGYAALGFLSRFKPWFGIVVYAIAVVTSVQFPETVFISTSLSNFLAIGYVVWTYSSQAASTAD